VSAIFRTSPWQVSNLVGAVESGSLQLPDLQRPFVWPTSKVRDLFDSMYRGYPVGMLMFWDVPAKGETRAIGGPVHQGASHQIVDGQQRLTSLFAAIKGRPVRDERYRNKDIRISFNPFTERFEVRTPAFAKSASWVEDISTCFGSPITAHKYFVERYQGVGNKLTEDETTAVERAFTRLHGLLTYTFDVVQVQAEVDKRVVADIFVRINSEGVKLKSSDYILTWLSVFWPDGREGIEAFARNSRITTERASELAGQRVAWTPHNPFIELGPGHLVRALVAVGQNRAKLSDAYSALQAKDRSTGTVDSDKQMLELDKLKSALPVVTKELDWDEFIRSLQSAGFRSRKGITSDTNLIYSYVIFLLGRRRYNVKLETLRTIIGRWFFMAQLRGRYTNSPETQLQRDLDRFGALAADDSAGFRRIVEEVIATELTNDFWARGVPELLVTSNAALSPAYQCYLAALNLLDADMFMLNMKVREWMDPHISVTKGVEGHHLFPRKYQENVLGIKGIKRINQAANFAPTDWDTNIQISDRAPSEYWPELVTARAADAEWLTRQRKWHALPDAWEALAYDDFLVQRRELIALVTREAFESLGTAGVADFIKTADAYADFEPTDTDWTLAELVAAELIVPGHALDPVDPDQVVDAVISDNGMILIDGVDEFDSLDAAAHHLGVTNISGFEYWGLELDGTVTALRDLVEGAERPV